MGYDHQYLLIYFSIISMFTRNGISLGLMVKRYDIKSKKHEPTNLSKSDQRAYTRLCSFERKA